MVLADSHGISRAPCYSGNPRECFFKAWFIKIEVILNYKTFTFSGIVFNYFVIETFETLCYQSLIGPTTLTKEVSLGQVPFRSPLLRESFLLFFPLGTKMFQFPRFALSSLWIEEEVLWSCLIRKPSDQSFLPAPRSVSPVIASFIASEYQGIPQKPFLS